MIHRSLLQMDNLVEMAEEQLAIHDEAGAAVLEIAPQPVAECLARSIVEFDPETYIEVLIILCEFTISTYSWFPI